MKEKGKQYSDYTGFDSQWGRELFFAKSLWPTHPPQMNTGAITEEQSDRSVVLNTHTI